MEISLPRPAMSVLMAECERRSLQPGYARVPNSRQDDEGNVWVCMSREEIVGPDGGVVQKAGIYLTCDVAASKVQMARDELHRVSKRLGEVIVERRHLQSTDVSGQSQHDRDFPVGMHDRPAYSPRFTARIAELAELEADLRAQEAELRVQAEHKTQTHYFPPDLAGVEFVAKRA